MMPMFKVKDINSDLTIKMNWLWKLKKTATGNIWLLNLPTIMEVKCHIKLDLWELRELPSSLSNINTSYEIKLKKAWSYQTRMANADFSSLKSRRYQNQHTKPPFNITPAALKVWKYAQNNQASRFKCRQVD